MGMERATYYETTPQPYHNLLDLEHLSELTPEEIRRETLRAAQSERRKWKKRARSGNPAKREYAKGAMRVIDEMLAQLGVR